MLCNANKGATFFKKLENDLDRAEKWARLTWQNNEHYPRENGVLLAGFTEEPVCKIKNKNTASPLAIRQFLGRQRTLMMVWSDAVDVIQHEIIVRLAYPLLKIERSVDNLVTISLKDPENFFEVEFQSPEAASEFLEMTAQACEYARLRISYAQGQLQFPQQRLTFETRVRHARYHFSAMHPRFPDCDYDGDWLDGQPHGKGQLKFPDERKYKGRFAYGQIDGMGEFFNNKAQTAENTTGSATPSAQQSSLMNSFFYSQPKCVLDSVRWVKGRFKDGLLHGLGSATFVNGDTYEGYWANGHMHGHGVFKAMGEDNIVVYVGGWQNGLKHGYGVQSTNKERYLGQWNEGKRHGNGSLVTIDGVFHEGIFENDKFVNGRVVYETSKHDWDPEAVVVFEGKFEDLNVAAGKGTLTLNQNNQIIGTMHGKILGNELAITNATYRHLSEGFESDEDFIMAEGAKRGKYAVHEEEKWVELFQHFLDDELKVSNEEFLSALNDDSVVPNSVAEKSWNSLAASLAKLKQQKKVTMNDRLERIPDYNMEWSSSYYAMVSEYWNLCVHNDFHPLNRLMRGIIELFSCSYSSVGTHVMYDTAVLEFRTLMSRCYAVTRLLFVNLPSTRDMFTSVPTLPDIHHDNTESETSSVSSARTPETLSVGSLEQLEMAQALLNDPDQPSTSREYSTNDSQTLRSNVEDITLLETPCCDFIINYLFSVCYADLFTVYSERCEALDRRYWERLLHLNAHTDAHLLRYFDVKGELWPTDNDNVRVLDAFTARVSARNKFYGSAVTRLQQISGVFNPTSKLAILAETFSEITQDINTSILTLYNFVYLSFPLGGMDCFPLFAI
ncbi:unnamed protein product [Bursaphelenchus xylophilus]|uniref:(pine wood nematode) hypothetical protein n=1 Tax=Bursaphelenchus xylophilus TaxID=6326 RepID=A0A1I7RP11_BURXY|nr:unnamed protein product [Bursaphelenchus xylophilus]CAG9124441.1 unnamed protein product [Bursaphelenchus xylophilus]